jgi:hypothetical protein
MCTKLGRAQTWQVNTFSQLTSQWGPFTSDSPDRPSGLARHRRTARQFALQEGTNHHQVVVNHAAIGRASAGYEFFRIDNSQSLL